MTKVVISNATRLHAHRHAFALQEAGLLMLFITSIWHRASFFPYTLTPKLPNFIRSKILSFLFKRQHAKLNGFNVKQVWGAEICRIIFDIITLGRLRYQLHLWQKIRFDKSAAKLVKALKPDVFVGFEVSCAKSMQAAKSVGAVTVLDLAGLQHDFALKQLSHIALPTHSLQKKLKRIKRTELDLADHVICVSDLSRRALIQAGYGRHKIHVITLGLNHDIFSAAHRDWNRQGQPMRIVYAGNLSRAKGVSDLVEAFKAASLDECELWLVGSLSDIPLTKLSGDNITIFPFMSAKKLAAKFLEADLFVLPSYLDSWGQVVPEALACGLPVVTTPSCGASQLITPENGRIFKAGDIKALANIFQEFSSGRAIFSSMGQQSVKAVAHLTWDSYELNIRQFYNSINDATAV